MTTILLVRHGEIRKQASVGLDTAFVDKTHNWPLTERGKESAKALGELIVREGLLPSTSATLSVPTLDRSKVEISVNDQTRLVQTLYHLGQGMGPFAAEMRTYRDEYLASRVRIDALGGLEDPLRGKKAITDESFLEFMHKGVRGFIDHVKRRSRDFTHFLGATSREFIVGMRFRFRGPTQQEQIEILRGLSHDNSRTKSEYDVQAGEMVMFADIHPVTGEGESGRFRWERVVNPSVPERSTGWSPIKVRTYTLADLRDPKLFDQSGLREGEEF